METYQEQGDQEGKKAANYALGEMIKGQGKFMFKKKKKGLKPTDQESSLIGPLHLFHFLPSYFYIQNAASSKNSKT